MELHSRAESWEVSNPRLVHLLIWVTIFVLLFSLHLVTELLPQLQALYFPSVRVETLSLSISLARTGLHDHIPLTILLSQLC